jgi:hypothetical protein
MVAEDPYLFPSTSKELIQLLPEVNVANAIMEQTNCRYAPVQQVWRLYQRTCCTLLVFQILAVQVSCHGATGFTMSAGAGAYKTPLATSAPCQHVSGEVGTVQSGSAAAR